MTSDSGLRPQQHRRVIAMTEDEVDTFLTGQRTCRLATIGTNGPHLSALWFVWHDHTLWLSSITKSQRWKDLAADPRTAVLVDDGEEYSELRGVEIRGSALPFGEAPRVGEDVPELVPVERLFARKYRGADTMTYDGRHGWLKLVPEKITSWDFRKMPSSRR